MSDSELLIVSKPMTIDAIAQLLGRIADAIERQTAYYEDIRASHARREASDAQDRSDTVARQKEADEYAKRQQATFDELVKNQRESLQRQREHESRCEAWHRKHFGEPPSAETSVN